MDNKNWKLNWYISTWLWELLWEYFFLISSLENLTDRVRLRWKKSLVGKVTYLFIWHDFSKLFVTFNLIVAILDFEKTMSWQRIEERDLFVSKQMVGSLFISKILFQKHLFSDRLEIIGNLFSHLCNFQFSRKWSQLLLKVHKMDKRIIARTVSLALMIIIFPLGRSTSESGFSFFAVCITYTLEALSFKHHKWKEISFFNKM